MGLFRQDERVLFFSDEGEWIPVIYAFKHASGYHEIITPLGFRSCDDGRLKHYEADDVMEEELDDEEDWAELMARLDTTVRAIERQQVGDDTRASLKVLSEGIQGALDAIADKVDKMFETLQHQILELEKQIGE